MRYPGHFDDEGEPVLRRRPEPGRRPKLLEGSRLEAIARFVEERELGSRNAPASTVLAPGRHLPVTFL